MPGLLRFPQRLLLDDHPLIRFIVNLRTFFHRFAAKGWIPANWFEPVLPPPEKRSARTEKRSARICRLHIGIASHCWHYSHLLAYQLSSLVRFPPPDIDLNMTVFYTPGDCKKLKLHDFFPYIYILPAIWNWRGLSKNRLFRRAIGRNLAAPKTKADWVWPTHCGLMFRESCPDTVAAFDVPGVYRIRHVFKGRYPGCNADTKLRPTIRKLQSRIRGH